jgi:hypothetical protein
MATSSIFGNARWPQSVLCALALTSALCATKGEAQTPAPAPAAPPPAPAPAAPADAVPTESPLLEAAPPATAAAPSAEASWAKQPPPPPREHMKFAFAWSMGFATGDLHDFVGDPSYRGFDLTFLFPIYRSFYIGASLATNHFYEEKPRATYEQGTSAVTAKLYRYADFWNTSLVTRYYFLEPTAFVRPYGSLRLGVAALSTTTFAADFAEQDNPVGFSLSPEVGALLRISKPVSLSVAYTYNFSTASIARFDNLSFGALQFGLSIEFPSN